MLRAFALSAAVMAAGISCAAAQSCEQNFSVSGVPMVTAVAFKTFQDFPKLRPDVALTKLAQGVAAEGFHGIKVDKTLSSVDAYQDTAGSGRLQTLRVVARKRGGGTRVDAVFEIQAGQIADSNIVRKGLCTIVESALD